MIRATTAPSLIRGTEGSGFTPDEVGAIYAANWERDLSQAHPSLGNVILAWKTMKVAVHEGRLHEAEMRGFQGAIQHLIESAARNFKGFLDATSYGGYQA